MNFKTIMVIDMPGAPDYKDLFNRMGGSFVKRECKTENEIIELGHDADFIITNFRLRPITRDVIHHLNQCKAILGIGIGYDGIDLEAATERAICVTNNPDYCVEEVSDHAMALILACSRAIVQLDHIVKSKASGSDIASSQAIRKLWFTLSILRKKILGIIGFGRISQRLVPKAKAFGMKLIAYDPYLNRDIAARFEVKMVELHELLCESDFVLVQASLTPETRHMMSLEQFKMMKPSAFFINTSRGAIVDEDSLYTALVDGYIAGAGLDVTDPEPPIPESPLLTLDNMIFSAHSAHASASSWARLWNNPVEEIARMLDGQWPQGLVNSDVKEKFVRKWGHMK